MNKQLFNKIKISIVLCIILAFIGTKVSNIIKTKDISKDITFYEINEGNEDETEENTDEVDKSESSISSEGLIDINTATSDELQTLYRIGPSLAQKIIDYREQYGGFTCIEEIKEVSGIGDATFEKIKEYIKVETNGKEN